LPLPSTTALIGSSHTITGRPVSSRSSTSRFLQQRAAAGEHDALVDDVGASSGGVRSSASGTASTMALIGSASASRISSELTTTVLGMPATRSRPFTSIVSCSSSG
jgi:hypothetical protein